MAEEHHNHHHLPPEPPSPAMSGEKHGHHPTKHVSPPGRSTYAYSPRRSHVASLVTVLLLLVGLTFLILWLLYRPHDPVFAVAAAAVYSLNFTAPPYLAAAFQFTVVARNPNRRVSILYDGLTAYVAYRGQAVTAPLPLPPLHQAAKTTVAMSPVIGAGGRVPVSAEVADGLAADEAYGVVPVSVVVAGRLRWKAGAVTTGRHRVYVRCDVWVGLKRGVSGQVPLLGSPGCRVDV
ncbi:unnamed protein product [Linum tenue]|uniref:Late embryogenesis abundant protein LEA-2 subgroup domain-containing protein n=1 Tax=Linum tenue TaxID=586396 RepID=A0AAV0IL26_9ROSI|nr:unnamed protein product [Linum tenue]